MKLEHMRFLAGAAAALLSIAAHAQGEDELLELINTYRADPSQCAGSQRSPVAPLAPDPKLDQLQIEAGTQLQEALRANGYQAARAQSLKLTGPSSAEEAMHFAEQLNCRLLLSERYSAAGVSRQGREWMIVLAQPQLDPELGDWGAAGRRVLELVNAARAEARQCGGQRYPAGAPLSWNEKLASASIEHSRNMAEHEFFGHEGRDGSTVEARATAQDYAWKRIGENVAAGQGSAQQVVDGWLSSPGHCANIMNEEFTEMGAAYATNPAADATIFWTQVFGTPR